VSKNWTNAQLLQLAASLAFGFVGTWCARIALLMSVTVTNPEKGTTAPIGFHRGLEALCALFPVVTMYIAIAVRPLQFTLLHRDPH
jgi:hypothetical protein